MLREGIRRFRRQARPAFTYVELVMALAIMAVLSAIAAPRYANYLTRQREQSAARRIMTDLSLAARRARLKSADQTVSFNVSADAYTVGDMAHPDDPAKPYVTKLAEPPYGATLVSASFGGSPDVTFNAFGVPSADGSIVIQVGQMLQTIPVTGADGGGSGGGPGVVDPKKLPGPILLTE